MVKTRAMYPKVSQSLLSNSAYSSSETNRSRVARGKVIQKKTPTQIYKQLAEVPYNERRIAKALLTDNSNEAWDEFVAYHLAHVCGRCTNYPNIQPSRQVRNKPIPSRIINCVKMGLRNGKRSAKEIVGLALEYAYHSGVLKKPNVRRKCYELTGVDTAKKSSKRAFTMDESKLRPKDSREIYRRRQKTANRYNDEKREDDSEPTERQKPRKIKPKQHTILQILSKSNITTTSIDKGGITGNIIPCSDNAKNPLENAAAKVQSAEETDIQASSTLKASTVINDKESKENNLIENLIDFTSANFNNQSNNEGLKHSFLNGSFKNDDRKNTIQSRRPFIIEPETMDLNNDLNSSSNQDNEENSAEKSNPYQYFL